MNRLSLSRSSRLLLGKLPIILTCILQWEWRERYFTDELVEFELRFKTTSGKITHRFKGIDRICLKFI